MKTYTFQGTKLLLSSVVLISLTLAGCLGSKSEILNGAIGKAEESAKNKDCKQQSKLVYKSQVEKELGRKLQGPARDIICPDDGIDTVAPVVTASPGAGNYGTSKYINLEANELAEIFYTLDGSDPTSNSPTYNGTEIHIDSTSVLSFFGIDVYGNTSAIKRFNYVIDGTLPDITIALVTRPAISGDTSAGPAATLDIHWQSSVDGDYAVELGGTVRNTGLYLTGGVVSAAPASRVTVISGDDLEKGVINTINIYVTNEVGITGFTSLEIPREDTPPLGQTNIAGGYYGAAQDVTISTTNESYGMSNIYYTTDGTDPALAPDEPDANSDGTSDACETYPFRPGAGMRCRLQNVQFTAPIHLEPYVSATANPLCPADPLECDRNVELRYFMEDAAGNVSSVNIVNYDIDLRTPVVTAQPSANSVRSDDDITVTFNPMADGNCQTARNPDIGDENNWNNGDWGAGAASASTAACIGGSDYQVTVDGQYLPGPSGTKSRIVLRNNNGGNVGSAVVEVILDDSPPEVTVVPSGGSYGIAQFQAGGLYSNGLEAVAIDDVSQGGNTLTYYTIETSYDTTPVPDPVNPSTASNLAAGGVLDISAILAAADAAFTAGTASQLNIKIKYLAFDEAGNQSPVYAEKYSVLQDGASLSITVPQSDIWIPKDGLLPVKVVNNAPKDQEIAISQQWRTECHAHPYGSGEVVASGTMAAGGYQWVNLYDALLPIGPDTEAGVEFTTSTTSSFTDNAIDGGSKNSVTVTNGTNYVPGGQIVIDVAGDGFGDDPVFTVTSIVDNSAAAGAGWSVYFEPELTAASANGVDIEYTAVAGDNYFEVDNALDVDGAGTELLENSYFTYNLDGVTRRITQVDTDSTPHRAYFSPPLDEASAGGAAVDYWGVSQRRVCMYTREVGSGGAYLISSNTVTVDQIPPQVNVFDNPNGVVSSGALWITKQYLANGGHDATTITFQVSGRGGKDEVVPAVYTIRKIAQTSSGEVATEIISSGIVTAENQTVYANVAADALADNGQETKFRIYVADPYGNVGSSTLGTLYRDDRDPTFQLTGANCSSRRCSVTFDETGITTGTTRLCLESGGGSYIQGHNGNNYYTNGSGSSQCFTPNAGVAYVPLISKETYAQAVDGDFAGAMGVSKTKEAFSVSASGESLWFVEKRLASQGGGSDGGWPNCGDAPYRYTVVNNPPGTVFPQDHCHTWDSGNGGGHEYKHFGLHYKQVWIGPYSSSATGDYTLNINWGNARVTSHGYEGSRVFTYENQYGKVVNMLVECESVTGCAGTPF